jgi:hypothetical protein
MAPRVMRGRLCSLLEVWVRICTMRTNCALNSRDQIANGLVGYVGRFLALYLHMNKLASEVRLVDKQLPELAWLAPEFAEACSRDKFMQADASKERPYTHCLLLRTERNFPNLHRVYIQKTSPAYSPAPMAKILTTSSTAAVKRATRKMTKSTKPARTPSPSASAAKPPAVT